MHTIQMSNILKDMENTVEILRKDPRKAYTVDDIQRMKVMPWARNSRTIVKILEADLSGGNLLGIQITGTDKYRRYLVPKKHLIKYLTIYGPGLTALARKPKQIYGRPTKARDHKGPNRRKAAAR